MEAQRTERLYLNDDHLFQTEARVTGVRPSAISFDRTCFYPGGGGQPSDEGIAELESGAKLEIASVQAEPDGVLWHATTSEVPQDIVGQSANLEIDRARRLALTRYHTVLHVLNTITLKDYGGWITGVQMSVDRSRIDFKLDRLTPELCAELEQKVNAVLAAGHHLKAYTISEEEFRTREDLIRTLDVKPPVIDGHVRVVEIVGFDAQACGGTHVDSTTEVGRFSIVRTENKGKNNKRLYIQLESAAAGAG